MFAFASMPPAKPHSAILFSPPCPFHLFLFYGVSFPRCFATGFLFFCKQALLSLWDGVVMGGGVGISINGTFRVATETVLFAMPETGNGATAASAFRPTVDARLIFAGWLSCFAPGYAVGGLPWSSRPVCGSTLG